MRSALPEANCPSHTKHGSFARVWITPEENSVGIRHLGGKGVQFINTLKVWVSSGSVHSKRCDVTWLNTLAGVRISWVVSLPVKGTRDKVERKKRQKRKTEKGWEGQKETKNINIKEWEGRGEKYETNRLDSSSLLCLTTWRHNLKIWRPKSTNSARVEVAIPAFTGDKLNAAWPAGQPHVFIRHCALHPHEIQILAWKLNVYNKTCKLFFGWPFQIDFHWSCQYLCILPPIGTTAPPPSGLGSLLRIHDHTQTHHTL